MCGRLTQYRGIHDFVAALSMVPETWSAKGKSWEWWQHSSKGQVDGIHGPVDLDWVKS